MQILIPEELLLHRGAQIFFPLSSTTYLIISLSVHIYWCDSFISKSCFVTSTFHVFGYGGYTSCIIKSPREVIIDWMLLFISQDFNFSMHLPEMASRKPSLLGSHPSRKLDGRSAKERPKSPIVILRAAAAVEAAAAAFSEGDTSWIPWIAALDGFQRKCSFGKD
jgi:hypothetical protein